MSVKLSATIVAYNNYDDVKEALISLEEWTNCDLSKRVYIVDNGADLSDSKSSLDFVEFIARYSDIEYINAGRNLGFGSGHNLVLNRLESQYHAIINPDILFCEDALQSITDWMDENPDVGMVIPYIMNEQGERQLVYRRELTAFDLFVRYFGKGVFKKRVNWHTLQDMDYSKPFQVPFGQGSFLVIRTDLFQQLKGFDKHFFMYVEDADLCKRVNGISKLMYYPDARVIHKWEQGSHSNKTLFKYHLASMKYYFKKWGLKLF